MYVFPTLNHYKGGTETMPKNIRDAVALRAGVQSNKDLKQRRQQRRRRRKKIERQNSTDTFMLKQV